MLTVAGEQPDAVALAPRQDAKAVVLDFMNPNVAGRRRACPSRKTGLEGGTPAPPGQHRHAMGDRRVRCRLPNRRLDHASRESEPDRAVAELFALWGG